MHTRDVQPGMLVRTAAGKKLGLVERLDSEFFQVKRSGLFAVGGDFGVRYEDVVEQRDGFVVARPGALLPLPFLRKHPGGLAHDR